MNNYPSLEPRRAAIFDQGHFRKGKTISLQVNGIPHSVDERYFDWTLLRYLRDALALTGTKQSCDNEGTCGACTVIINGRAKRACLTKMQALDAARVETIESLQVEAGQAPHPLVQTVVQDGIFQCGYCAPGAILSARSLLDEKPDPTDKEIEKALSTVICRCAGLNRMDLSVKRAAAILRGDASSTWTSEDNANEERILARVTGRQVFTADLTFSEILYAQAVRARVPHARLLSLDIRQAQALPGVVAVLTAKDIPGQNAYGAMVADQVVFIEPGGEIKHVADVLALVVAETQEQAAAGAALVAFDLEPLPVIASVEQALAQDAPVLHERLRAEALHEPNVLKHYSTRKGDMQAGWAAADVIVEGDYDVPFVEHAYMEIECSIAVPEEDGGMTVYCGTQGPLEDRHQVAAALGLAEERVRIAHMFMGGGFGGKEDIAGQIHAALAARFTGRPVKVQWNRAESIQFSTKRHAAKMHYKTGARRDGRLVAAEVTILGDTGPYASVGDPVLFRMCVFSCGPYVLPNVAADSYAVHTNNAVAGAFRGYGSPQVAFAAELQMQKLADALGMDALEFRRLNGLGLGDATITGDILTEELGVGLPACLQAVQEAMQRTPPLELEADEKLGVGIAAAYKNVGMGTNLPDSAGARASLEPDGTFLIRHGATDMGQGINDVMATIAARVLEVPLKYIRVHTADTRDDPPGGMTTASRQTFISGNATLQASQELRAQLWKAVTDEFPVAAEDLCIVDGSFANRRTGQVYLSLAELARGSSRFEVEVTYHAPQTQPPPKWSASEPQVSSAPMHFAYDFGVQAAYVAVNQKTGAVRVIKVIAAHDVGLPISRRNVIGQIEGAVIQGIGYALSESFPVQDGVPQISKFKDLGLLRFRDVPQIEPIIVEDAHPKGPFGAKGMGELTITPTAPAIVNAIHDAVGVWVNSLPVTREKLLAAIRSSALSANDTNT